VDVKEDNVGAGGTNAFDRLGNTSCLTDDVDELPQLCAHARPKHRMVIY
jgi:hypothetical protein